jgi:hypothetical protein
MDPSSVADMYTTRLEEALWGALLVAITLAVHGVGMLLTLRAINALQERLPRKESLAVGLVVIIGTSWMIILVHLVEVGVWAHFFLWKQAVAGAYNNLSLCYYFALMDYTTLGSNYNLKLHWRLLEGMIGIAGLLTFAWSTGILLTFAQEYQERHLAQVKARRAQRLARTTATPANVQGKANEKEPAHPS